MRIIEVCPGKDPEVKSIGFELEASQEEVGGYIQCLDLIPDDPVCLVCNEDGKRLKLPVNRFLYFQDINYIDPICGTFFLVGAGRDDFMDFPEELIEKYTTMFLPDIVKI